MRLSVASILIIVAAVITAAVGSAYVTYWWYAAGPSEPTGANPSADGTRALHGVPFRLSEITANLRSENGRAAFVRTVITLEVVDQESARLLAQQEDRVRDRIISILRGFTATQIEAPGGTDRIKEEIKRQIDPLLDRGEVLDVLFSELVVAR